MTEFMKMLNGNKSNIGFLGLGLVVLLTSYGQIDPATSTKLLWAIGAWTGIAVRHGIQKVEEATKPK